MTDSIFKNPFAKDYNEIYTIFNKLREKKDNKFDYECSNGFGDEHNYLNLNCQQAKILKYILQINYKNKNTKNLIVTELSNKKIDLFILRDILTEVLNPLIHIIKDIEDKNPNIKKLVESMPEQNKLEQKQTGGGRGKVKNEGAPFLIKLILALPSLAFFVGSLLTCCLVGPYLKYKGYENIVDKIMTPFDIYTKAVFGQKGGNQKMNYEHIHIILVGIYGIIEEIITEIESKKFESGAEKIYVTNICVNGKEVKERDATIIKHVKCKSSDYENIKIIKEIFKNLDKNIEKLENANPDVFNNVDSITKYIINDQNKPKPDEQLKFDEDN